MKSQPEIERRNRQRSARLWVGLICLVIVLLLALSFPLSPVEAGKAGDHYPTPIPTIPVTGDDPILPWGSVYPFWGAPCTRFTYHVVYRDEKGRPPEYVRIFLNGDWIQMQPFDPDDDDYQRGVIYIYPFVPTVMEDHFYFIEASNGLGKARVGIIVSPAFGPTLFASPLNNNEIALIDPESGTLLWRFHTGEEWVEGIALSDNGEVLAAKTSYHIYLFETGSDKPVWEYAIEDIAPGEMRGNVDGGVDISADGSRIFGAIGETVYLFDKGSNQPLWQFRLNLNASDVSISKNGEYMAAASMGNALLLFNEASNQPLWVYQAPAYFHPVAVNADGSFIAAGTGCPDRRAYVFSRDSNEPLVHSEMLTPDSPVMAAAISDDGAYAAFAAQESSNVFLFSRDSSEPLWQFEDPHSANIEALAMTPDGQYIASHTNLGKVYIFDRETGVVLNQYQVQEQLGAVDLADDGSFVVAGGSFNHLYLFNRSQEESVWQIELNEFVNVVDISGDNRYIAAGTGGSHYIFSTNLFLPWSASDLKCEEILEPPVSFEEFVDWQLNISPDRECAFGACEKMGIPSSTPVIAIDGDPSDWGDRQPLITDPEDSADQVAGVDLSAFYAFADEDFLYLRLDQHTEFPTQSVVYGFEIYTRSSSDPSTFVKVSVDAPDILGVEYQHRLVEYSNAAAIGDVLEAAVPLEAIGHPDPEEIEIFVEVGSAMAFSPETRLTALRNSASLGSQPPTPTIEPERMGTETPPAEVEVTSIAGDGEIESGEPQNQMEMPIPLVIVIAVVVTAVVVFGVWLLLRKSNSI